jgi:hypothetical protein
MPEVLKNYVYRRLWEVLTEKNNSPGFDHLSKADRKAIFEILQETKADFRAFVKDLR